MVFQNRQFALLFQSAGEYWVEITGPTDFVTLAGQERFPSLPDALMSHVIPPYSRTVGGPPCPLSPGISRACLFFSLQLPNLSRCPLPSYPPPSFVSCDLFSDLLSSPSRRVQARLLTSWYRVSSSRCSSAFLADSGWRDCSPRYPPLFFRHDPEVY